MERKRPTDAANATVERAVRDGPRSGHDSRHAGIRARRPIEATRNPESFTDGFQKFPADECGGAPRYVRASEPPWI
jgi:hypothetical protein